MDDGSIESKSERFYDNSSAEESEITNATHTATSLHTQSTTPQQPSYSSPMERSVSGTTGSSADLSFTMGGGSSEDIIDEEYYNRHHHHRHDDDYNEEELKTLAQSLAPRVTNLLDTNEKVLENLLELSWTNDDGDDGDDENNLKSRADYLEDGMEDEWNGLSNAEQMLRDELGMVSMGFNFVVNDDDYDDDDDDGDYDDDSQEDYGDYDHENPKDINIVQEKGDDNTSMVMDEQTKIMTNQLDDEAVGEDVNCNHDNDDDDGYNDSNINNEKIDPSNNTTSSNKVEQRRNTIHHNTTTHSVPQQTTATTATTTTTMPSPTNRQAYTLYDHAKYVDLQFSNIDLGYPTCPLLTKNDAESLLDIPNFRHEMLKNMEKVDKKVNESSSECTNNNNNNSSSKEEYHHSVMSSFREVKLPNNDQPMSMIDTSSNNHHHHHTLAASAGLTAIIGKSGKAYTFGLNRSGQCGVGNKDAVHIWNPTPLDFASTEIIHHISLNDDKDDYKDDKIITDVALGLQHGLVLDDKGLIYAFGKAARGQLGIADDDMTEQNIDHEYSPVQIRHFRMDSADSLDGDTTSSKMSESDVQVNRISAGWNHCAVVTDNNHAWIWGKNVLIDDNKTIDSAIPVRINGIPDELAIIDISCGSHHTSILMEDGSVYATGIATDANVPVGGGSVLQIVPPGIIDMPVTQFKSHFDRTTIIAGDNGEQILEVQLWSTDELRQQAVFEPAWVETMFGDCSKIEQVHRGWKHTVILGQK